MSGPRTCAAWLRQGPQTGKTPSLSVASKQKREAPDEGFPPLSHPAFLTAPLLQRRQLTPWEGREEEVLRACTLAFEYHLCTWRRWRKAQLTAAVEFLGMLMDSCEALKI